MNLFTISGLFTASICLVFGTFIFLRGSKKIHYIWGFLSLAVAGWGLGVYKISTETDAEMAVFWWRMAYIGVIFIPVFITHFVAEFLQFSRKWFIFFIYSVTFAFLLLDVLTDHFINNVRFVFDQFYYISQPTLAYNLFVVMFFGLVLFDVFKLACRLRKHDGLPKSQVLYFLVAVFVGFGGGGFAFLPVYNLDVYPVLNVTISFSVFIVAYAMFKHHLMNLKVAAVEMYTIIMFFLLFLNIFSYQNNLQLALNIVAFVGVAFFGILLIQSTRNEIKRKEELQIMSDRLASANDQLRKLDNAKSEFISIASHQLRTPLTAIKGFISLLLEGTYGKVEPRIRDALNKVYLSNERMVQLVENLLNISRMESGKMEFEFGKWKIDKIINELYDSFIMIAREKKLSLEIKLPEEPVPEAEVDGAKVREVISNLVDNALKYTEKGGVTVTLETGKGKRVEGEVIRVIISDTGIGIPSTELPYLFSKFSRGKDQNRLHVTGNGLGLYVGKQMIEAQHGRVWAESEGEGRGSKFIIELPVSQEKYRREQRVKEFIKEI